MTMGKQRTVGRDFKIAKVEEEQEDTVRGTRIWSRGGREEEEGGKAGVEQLAKMKGNNEVVVTEEESEDREAHIYLFPPHRECAIGDYRPCYYLDHVFDCCP